MKPHLYFVEQHRALERIDTTPQNGCAAGYALRMTLNPAVDAWFETYDNPMKDAVQRVREIIMSDERMSETIKWKSPTFMYKGNMASFNPRTKSHVSLMFHTGASIPGDHSRLEGGGDTARYVKFSDLADVEASANALLAIVDAWCQSRD